MQNGLFVAPFGLFKLFVSVITLAILWTWLYGSGRVETALSLTRKGSGPLFQLCIIFDDTKS